MTESFQHTYVADSLDPMVRLRPAYPQYQIDTMLTGSGRRYQARALSLSERLYAVITSDLGELEAVLATAAARPQLRE